MALYESRRGLDREGGPGVARFRALVSARIGERFEQQFDSELRL